MPRDEGKRNPPSPDLQPLSNAIPSVPVNPPRTASAFFRLFLVLLLAATAAAAHAADRAGRPDLLIADFEGKDYGPWKTEGEAFGAGPARGTLPHQMKVSGYEGRGLVNSFVGGDRATGSLTSPFFKIERRFIRFLIGGGGYEGTTCMNLVVDGKTVRTAVGPNTRPGGSEALGLAAWDVSEFVGKQALIRIVDARAGGWGHINVDQIAQTDSELLPAEKTLKVTGSHLIVPVANSGRGQNLRLAILDGERLVQNFNVMLPRAGEPHWLAAYALAPFGLDGRTVTIKPEGSPALPESIRASFNRIHTGPASEALEADDYDRPYRNQFHLSSRRGWNNDPNGMVFHGGKYHVYYQHNPFGIGWGNMHWGHFESPDLVHWEEKPLALYQKTVGDMAFSGGGFVDFNNSAGCGKGALFVSFTSTGRGECLAWSDDGGLTFNELKENPVVEHRGRDPRVFWFAPEKKWVMVVFDDDECAETTAVPPSSNTPKDRVRNNFAFYESKDLHRWARTGAFTDPDRMAVFECPEMFELPVEGRPGETRWVLYGAQNRYFIGRFDGRAFHKESGPHGSRHGAFYAAQTFSDTPDGRRIQIGWVRTAVYHDRFPDQIVNQAFTLPHTMALRETPDGLRLFFNPVEEVEKLRGQTIMTGENLTAENANQLLSRQPVGLTEVQLEFTEPGPKKLTIDGIDASFTGRSARIFTDRTFNEVYADNGAFYEVRTRSSKDFESTVTAIADDSGKVNIRSLKVIRLKSIWPKRAGR